MNRDPLLNHAHEDIIVAVDDAFDAMERILKEYSREIQGEVKRDVVQDRGLVQTIFPEEGYGFIQSKDGRDIYFHRNSVLNGGFDRLRKGTEVRFNEEEGEKGPQVIPSILRVRDRAASAEKLRRLMEPRCYSSAYSFFASLIMRVAAIFEMTTMSSRGR